MKIGKGSCNGTFGELLQGELDGRPFLVTFPIKALESKATFIPSKTGSHVISLKHKSKAIEACIKLLQMFNVNKGGSLLIESNIPVGKGMASSSTDVVSAIRAVADSFNLSINEEIISSIASEIEPTDGVMYEEIVAYDFINGKLIEKLGSTLAFNIIGIDLGGVIDTIGFNRLPKKYDDSDRKMFSNAYQLVKKGIKNNDLSLICKGSTISARINQKILPKPYFVEFERLASLYNGGLIIAHSGTIIGILIEPDSRNIQDLYVHFSKKFREIIENTGVKPFYFCGGDTRKEVNYPVVLSDM